MKTRCSPSALMSKKLSASERVRRKVKNRTRLLADPNLRAVGLDTRRNQLAGRVDVENRSPIWAPSWTAAATRRHRPPAPRRRKRLHVDLLAPGLVRLVSDEFAVRCECRPSLGQCVCRQNERRLFFACHREHPDTAQSADRERRPDCQRRRRPPPPPPVETPKCSPTILQPARPEVFNFRFFRRSEFQGQVRTTRRSCGSTKRSETHGRSFGEGDRHRTREEGPEEEARAAEKEAARLRGQISFERDREKRRAGRVSIRCRRSCRASPRT